ncbi:uncharacterized protein LOC128963431 [Oppia nitens]|uniref:uncharacterized protein LOC128963431 n=1 Tax=Oppia nitens TaxID=1686743 RepID=UPI0023DC7FF1|nr:uncharacterized protein LOC128963431 [Oppia nitens]
MDELADELSSTMIDVDHHINTSNVPNNGNHDIDGQTDAIMRSVKSQKPVARSASILIRSKLLILSDSESDESNCGSNSKTNQMSARKAKRNNKKQNPLNSKTLYQKDYHNNGYQMSLHSTSYTGKRKRSSTISEPNHSSTSTNVSIQMDCDNDMTETSSLSETSDDYNSDYDFDGDDEQSDFYEVIKTNKTPQRQRHHNHSHTSRAIDFAVPSVRNPFLTMGLSPASTSFNSTFSSANMLWKRRRRMH